MDTVPTVEISMERRPSTVQLQLNLHNRQKVIQVKEVDCKASQRALDGGCESPCSR